MLKFIVGLLLVTQQVDATKYYPFTFNSYVNDLSYVSDIHFKSDYVELVTLNQSVLNEESPELYFKANSSGIKADVVMKGTLLYLVSAEIFKDLGALLYVDYNYSIIGVSITKRF